MLRSLVEKSVETLKNSESITKEFSSELKSNQSLGLDNIVKMMDQHTSAANKENSQISNDFTYMKEEQMKMLTSIEQSRLGLETSLGGVSDTVGTQKDTMSNTVSKMVQHMNTSIQDATVAVSNTSQTANKILQDVTNASANMNGNAVESMDHFTNFLNTKGDGFKTDISAHFFELSTYLDDQSNDVREMGNQIENYSAKVIATKVEVTGKTPLKTIFKSLSQLPHTREHEIIKNEVRRNPDLFALNENEPVVSINISSQFLVDEASENITCSNNSNHELISSIRSANYTEEDNQENIKPEVLNKIRTNNKAINNSMKLKTSQHKDSSIPSLRSTRNNALN